MSVYMDTGDLLGGLSNLCLIAAVRRVPTPVTLDGVRLFLEQTFAADLRRFSIALASYTALPLDDIVEAVERLIALGESDWYETNNLNMVLGLLTRPMLRDFPFVTCAAVDEEALLRPFVEVTYNLLHAAARVRMQSSVRAPQGELWSEASAFIVAAWPGRPGAEAFAATTIAEVITDLVDNNSAIADRTQDAQLIAAVREVLAELHVASPAR
jgi:hypothetical protein